MNKKWAEVTHKKKEKIQHDPQSGQSTTRQKKNQLSFTASNIATIDYSVLSLMMNKNIGTI